MSPLPEPRPADDQATESLRAVRGRDRDDDQAPAPPRIFLRETGWSVAVKVGSDRTYCHSMAPGEDYYHRIADAEVYLTRGDQRFCFPCANRLELLTFEPKQLRPAIRGRVVETGAVEEEYPLGEVRSD